MSLKQGANILVSAPNVKVNRNQTVMQSKIGIIGATSFVGQSLLSLVAQKSSLVAFSRSHEMTQSNNSSIQWRNLDIETTQEDKISQWICLAPIWVLPKCLHLLEAYGAKSVVALSSTSCFTKMDSCDAQEKKAAKTLLDSENKFKEWAVEKGVKWVILRPTMIYGFGKDRNISSIIRFLKIFRFYPVLGTAEGKRQPIHVNEVAAACYSALKSSNTNNRSYNISGKEIFTYREMLSRISIAMGQKPRVIQVPLSLFKFIVAILRFIPRYKKLSTGMVLRMNKDMVFDHADATNDFGFKPGNFDPADCNLKSSV